MTQVAIHWFRQEDGEKLPLGRAIPGWGRLFHGGIPKTRVLRQDVLDLQTWLDQPPRVLADVYPEGLDDEDRQRYSAEMDWLAGQPWSPHQRLKDILAAWPEDEPIRTIMDHNPYEAEFVAALEEFVAEHWDELPDDLRNPPQEP